MYSFAHLIISIWMSKMLHKVKKSKTELLTCLYLSLKTCYFDTFPILVNGIPIFWSFRPQTLYSSLLSLFLWHPNCQQIWSANSVQTMINSWYSLAYYFGPDHLPVFPGLLQWLSNWPLSFCIIPLQLILHIRSHSGKKKRSLSGCLKHYIIYSSVQKFPVTSHLR